MKEWIGKWWLLVALIIASPAIWSIEFATEGAAFFLTIVTGLVVAPLVFFGMRWKPEDPPVTTDKFRGDGGAGIGGGSGDGNRSDGGLFSDFFGGGDGGAGGGGDGGGGG